MASEEQVRESLETVLVPAVKRSIGWMNLVREVTTSDKEVNVTLASTGLIPGAQDWIKTKAKEAIGKLPEVNSVSVEYTNAKAKDLNEIAHIERNQPEVESVIHDADLVSEIAQLYVKNSANFCDFGQAVGGLIYNAILDEAQNRTNKYFETVTNNIYFEG